MKELFTLPSVKREPVPATVLEVLSEDSPSPRRVAARFASQPFVVRPEGWRATGDEAVAWLNGLKKPGMVFRGMTSDEYRNTVGKHSPIKSTGQHSLSVEGTCFTEDAGDAEGYVNFGRDDPRKTGKPTYLVAVEKTPTMYRDRDGYDKDREPVPYDNVIGVWEMYGEDGAVWAKKIK